MAKPIKVQRVERALALQFDPTDEESTGIIRGWLEAPIDADLAQYIPVESWVIKNPETGAPYIITTEQYLRDFIVVLDA